MGDELVVEKHSWNGLMTHVFRSDGRIYRARIGNLHFQKYCICFTVCMRGVHKPVYKHVLPLEIAGIDVLWSNIDVLSDQESVDVDEFNLPVECSQDMPPLTLDASVVLTSDQRNAFNGLCLSINNFMKLKTTMCPSYTSEALAE